MKKIIAFLCCLSMAFGFMLPMFSLVAESNTGVNQTALFDDRKIQNSSTGIEISAILEKSNYQENEDVSISFSISSNIEFEADLVSNSINYETNGFNVKQEPYFVENYLIKTTLNYQVDREKASFKLCLSLSQSCVGVTVYAISTDSGLYISNSSYDAAKREYYYRQKERGLIDDEEYQAVLMEECKNSGRKYTEEEILENQESSILPASSNLHSTIAGRFGWVDDNNNLWHPMQFTKVDIIDYTHDVLLATEYTDKAGNFSFSYLELNTSRKIYVKVYPGGANTMVVDANDGEYAYPSGIYTVAAGASAWIYWDADMGDDLGKAFQVSQAAITAARYAETMNSSPMSSVTIEYPHNESNANSCYYNKNQKKIFIRGDVVNNNFQPYESWDVIMHEYGHHVQNDLGLANSPGGSHVFTYNNIDYRYEENYNMNSEYLSSAKYDGIRLGWNEGWATVFGTMAQQYYLSDLENIYTVGDAVYTAYNGLNNDFETGAVRLGEGCEVSVIAVLYDWYDGSNVADINYTDSVYWGNQTFWNYSKNSQATTFSGFVNYVYNISSISAKLNMGAALEYYGMAASDINLQVSGNSLIVTWSGNGGSTYCPNNEFQIVFYSSENEEVYRSVRIIKTDSNSRMSYTLSGTAWNNVLNSSGTKFRVSVVAYQTTSPVTGGYYSSVSKIEKPV